MIARTQQAPGEALIQIDKVLQLELRQGFRDTSTTGGVARFAGERLARLLAVASDRSQRALQELDALLADYGRLSAAERTRSVAEARRLLAALLQGIDEPSGGIGSPEALGVAIAAH